MSIVNEVLGVLRLAILLAVLADLGMALIHVNAKGLLYIGRAFFLCVLYQWSAGGHPGYWSGIRFDTLLHHPAVMVIVACAAAFVVYDALCALYHLTGMSIRNDRPCCFLGIAHALRCSAVTAGVLYLCSAISL